MNTHQEISENSMAVVGVSYPLATVINNIINDGDHDMAERILNGVVDMSDILKKLPEDSRVRTIHEWLDNYIEEDNLNNLPKDMKVSCAPGCNACCSVQVDVQEEEADYIYNVVKRKGISLDRERLAEQAGYSMTDYQKNFFSGKSRCTLLGEDGRCMIYEERPAVCRLHVSLSDSDLCKPTPEGEARDHLKFARISAEMLYSAYMQKGDGSIHSAVSLPKALLRRLEKDEYY